MQSKIIGTFWVTTICCVVSVLALMGVQAECVDVSITPSRIILNVECVGSSQDIQAIFPFVWPTNYEFVEGRFYFGDDEDPVCTTSFHYCELDYNLLVSFDRGEIQLHAKDNDLADGVYTQAYRLKYVAQLQSLLSLWWPFHPLGYAIGHSFNIDLIWTPLCVSWILKKLLCK